MKGGKFGSIAMLLALLFSVGVKAQTIRTILGDGSVASGASDGNGGQSVNARITIPYGVAIDRKGNIYVSDQNENTVRKIRPDGVILRYAGTGNPNFGGDGGPAINAFLSAPSGLACDTLGNLYIADAVNHVVRRVDTFGIITTYAGNHALLTTSGGGDGGPATAAPLGACSGIAFDKYGNLYIANGNDRVRKVTPGGIISTVAGGTIGYTGNGGPATAAAMEGVSNVYVDTAGILYISEQVNNVVRKVDASGTINVVAGLGPSSPGSSGDGGLATAAKLNFPCGMIKDASGNLYICDVANNKIRKITPAGTISTYTGTTQGYGGDGGPYNAATVKYYYPTCMALDKAGHMLLTDKGPGYTGTGGGRRLREIFKVDTFHLQANPGTALCSSDTVNIIANLSASYYSYIFTWRKNGTVVGGNTSAYHPTSIANGDRVWCTITDTAHGLNLTLAVSDTLTFTVSATVTPSVSFTTSADTVCAGTHVTFNATAVNGGTAPAYQWLVSGTAMATGATFDYAPANSDTVKVILTSNANCLTTATASASRVMTVRPLPNAGVISGPTTMCPGDAATLTSSGMTGGTWSASNSAATISATGVVNAMANGTDTFTYTVSVPSCGSATATKVININSTPSAGTITGLAFVCPGSVITLNNTTTGGTWTMSNAHATISSSGAVTGVSAGADTAVYTVTNSCGTAVARFPLTVGVSSLMDAGTIAGPATACAGSTVTLSDTATGGFWGTTDAGVASVSSSGVVTAMAPGAVTIYYVVTSGCSPDTARHNMTVIPVLDAGTISGTGALCNGLSATLSVTGTGGAWSSTNATVAAVDGTGHISALSPGTTTIRYIVGNSCGSDTATHDMTIAPQPFADTITGALLLCVGSATTLTDTASGGVWSSSDAGIATVTTTGQVTALASGSVTITYSVTNACGTDIATHHISINAFPVFTSSSHPPAICSGTLFSYEPTSTVSSAIYNWTRPVIPGILNPLASSTGNPNEILINTTSSPIDVVYVFSANSGGCATIQNVTVTVNPIPSLSSDLTVSGCSGREFVYVPTSNAPAATFVWTRAAVAGVTPATGSGVGAIHETLTNPGSSAVSIIYMFTISAAGCVDTQNILMTLEPQGPPPPVITTHSPSWVCKNTMFQNFGTSSAPDSTVNYEWTAYNAVVWSQGAGHQYSLVSFPYPGLATIYLTSSITGHSCGSRDSFSVYVDYTINELPSVNYEGGVFMAQDGMSTYQWGYDDAVTLDSTILAGETGKTYANASPDFAGKYYWVVTEHLLCRQKTYYQVPAGVTDANAGIRQVSVYPNPATGMCTVKVLSSVTEKGTITLTDMAGRTVVQTPCITNGQNEIKLNCPAGVYLVHVITPHGSYVTRLTVTQ